MGAVMKVFMKAIFLTIIIFSFVYSQIAPDFLLKDRNNSPIKLSEFKNEVLILMFTNTKDKITIEKAKELRNIFDKDKVGVVIITTDKDLSSVEFNRFVVENNLEESGIYALKGDRWILKAYSVKPDKVKILILRKGGDKFFILKEFNSFDKFNEIRLSVETILDR